jgi:tetratricopeptide (TPR) repeat protein
LAGVLLITLVAFAGSFSHDFVSLDDATHVTQNPLVLNQRYDALLTTVVNNSYIPVTMLSLAANVTRPLTAKPFLVTNVLVHVLNTALVFWLVYLLSRRRLGVAVVAALLFGIHPMRVESVAWVSSRKDVLYVLFLLAGLIAYWRYLEKRSWPWLALTFALFLLSCLSKAMAVVFPLLLVLLDFWKRRPVFERTTLLEKAPFFAVSLLFGLIAIDVEKGGGFHGLFQVVDKQLVATVRTENWTTLQRIVFPTYGHLIYVTRLFVPTGLGAYYPYPTAAEAAHPQYPLSILFFLGTIALALWSVRHARTLAFGLGWWLLVILPVLQWIPVGASMLADRMTYLAYVGPFFLAGVGVDALWERRRQWRPAILGVLAIVAALFFFETRRQVETWRNSEALWANVIHNYPRAPVPYISRGNALGEKGRIEDAMADFRTAVALGSRRGDLYDGLGNAYGSLGKPDSALLMYNQALEIDPTLGRTYYNRAIVQLRLQHPREALADLDRSLQVMPIQAASLHFPRGNAYLQLGMYSEAEGEFTRAIDGGQLVTDARFNRGLARMRLGNTPGAREDFQEILRLDPGYLPARDQLRTLGQ